MEFTAFIQIIMLVTDIFTWCCIRNFHKYFLKHIICYSSLNNYFIFVKGFWINIMVKL